MIEKSGNQLRMKLMPKKIFSFSHTISAIIAFRNSIIIFLLTSKQKPMKKMPLILAVLLAVFAIFSCQKTSVETSAASASELSSGGGSGSSGGNGGSETGRGGGSSNDCFPTVANIIAGQNMIAGTITIRNDSTNIYVTYHTDNGWSLTRCQLYVGDSANIPVNNSGNATPGRFPYKSGAISDTTYSFTVPISALGNATCGYVVAHCGLIQRDEQGNTIQTQTGWGFGTPITSTQSNWGMKTSYCKCSL